LGPFDEQELRSLLPQYSETAMTCLDGLTDLPRRGRDILTSATVVIASLHKEQFLGDDLLQLMPNCRFIQVPAVGYDSVDVEAAARRGIPVSNLPGFNVHAVADWTVMAILAIVRRAAWGHGQVESGQWPVREMRSHDLRALTIGIVGFGRIGQAVAARLAGFGSAIIANDITSTCDGDAGIERVSLLELCRRSHVTSLHVPLTDKTRGMIGAEQLAAMPYGSWLVCAGRGGVVDEVALVDALDRGQLAGAALDVFAAEPLPPDSPLRGRPDVLLSPHVGGETWESFHGLRALLADNVGRVLRGEPPEHVVNNVLRGGPAL
jgi:D-3-phosphoglycerate dehydrogenase